MKTLIRNSRILLPEGELYTGDLLIESGAIAAIDRELPQTGVDRVVEANGHLLMAGVIDPQVHFREPGKEHKEDLLTASHACAKGGVTSFLEMPNTDPLTINQASLDDKLARAASKCVVNYGFFIGATLNDNTADLNAVQPACGIKIFMGSMHGPLHVDEQERLEAIFRDTRRLIAVHAEDHSRIQARRQLFAGASNSAIHSVIQDPDAALIATQRAIALAERYQHRLHILHLSTAEEALYLRQHKPSFVTAEVTPQHLFLSTDAYASLGSLVQMNPPLRPPGHQDILWQALRDGVLDFIATDHAPHTLSEKAQTYPQSPSGMPGVETTLPLMLTAMHQGRCTLTQVTQWLSRNAARGFGIPNKGEIRLGWDADLVLVDLDTPKVVRNEDLLTKCGWSPFAGWELRGWPLTTWVNGEIAFTAGAVDPNVRGKALTFASA